jgi:phage terminase Nu1 subunit (DNA packaging protein)
MAAQTYPVAVICKLLDLTPRRIRQLVDEGVIQRAERGQYELVSSVRGYIRYLRDRALVADGGLVDESARANRARLIKAQAEAQEMENARYRHEFVHNEDAAWIIERVIVTLRAKVMTLKAKIPPKAFGCNRMAELEGIVEQECHDILREIAEINSGQLGRSVEGDTGEAGARAPAPEIVDLGMGGPVPNAFSRKQRRPRGMGYRKR